MEPDLNSILQAAIDARPSDFQSQTNDILGQKIMDALDRRRQELAQSTFASQTEVDDNDVEVEVDSAEVEAEINSDDDSNEVVDTQIEEPNGQDA